MYRRPGRLLAGLRRVGGWLTLPCAVFGLPAALVSTRQVWLDLDVRAAVVQPMTMPVLVFAVVAAGWLLWAWLVVATVLDVAAVLTRGARTVRLLPTPLQTTVTTLAGSLLMAITSVTSGASTGGGAPPAGVATHTLGPPTDVLPAPAVNQVTALPDLIRVSMEAPAVRGGPVNGTSVAARGTHGQPMTVTVRRGDTLWSISERCLGDPHRWREIYRLNAGRYDRAGRMHAGEHIEPTWVLMLPGDAQPGASAGSTDPGDGSVTTPPATQAQPRDPGPPATTTTQVPDDGVTGQHPPVLTIPTTANPVAGRTGQPGPTDRTDHGGVAGIGLFSGSWVDAGLVGAIVAAVALVWAHRRRRYVPRTPSAAARLDDSDVTAMPDVVRMLRRGARTSTTDASPADGFTADASTADTTVDEEHTGGSRHEDDGSDHVEAPDADPRHDETADHGRGAAGTDGAVLRWHQSAGLGLVGPGAEAAARGLLVTAVADGADDPWGRSVVIIPAPTAVRLFGTVSALPDIPRIVITRGLPDALERLEAVTLHRTRVLQQHAVDTVANLRGADPLEEPLPPTILLTGADTLVGDRGRVTALLQQGRRLDVHGVVLGTWPEGDTVAVAADGTTTPAGRTDDAPTAASTDSGARHAGDVGRLTVLTADEAADLLNVLAAAHTGQPQAAAANESTPPDGTSDHDARTAHGAVAGPDPDTPPAGTAPTAAVTPRSTGAAAPPPDPAGPDRDADAAAGVANGHASSGVTGDPIRRVAVELLGAARVVDADTSRGTLRAKSLELLAYLAIHDGAVHYESILDDLLPDAPANKAVHRLHTYISDLRQILRRTGGDDTYITRTGQRYLLNRDAFDVDLWRMRTALHEAELADSPADRIAAWQATLHAYRGPLADGVDYEWVEPHREATRRQAVDAALALADALADQPHEVIRILDDAIRHSPHTEALYQAAMRANAAVGRLDTVRTLRHTLARELADIDAEPSEETTALANQLLTVTPPARRNRQQPQPRRVGAPAIPSAGHRPASRAGQATVRPADQPTPPRPARDTDTAA